MQICPNCGYHNRPGVVFCENCGASLIGKAPLSTKSLDDAEDGQSAGGVDTSIVTGAKVEGIGVFQEGSSLRLSIEGSPEPIHLKPKPETIFGRRDPATGAMPDIDLTPYAGYRMGVSRRHAAIRFGEEQSLDIWDLGSSNGTFLNGDRLSAHRPYRLRDGDELRLGQMAIRVYFQATEKPAVKPAAPQTIPVAAAESAEPKAIEPPTAAAESAEPAAVEPKPAPKAPEPVGEKPQPAQPAPKVVEKPSPEAAKPAEEKPAVEQPQLAEEKPAAVAPAQQEPAAQQEPVMQPKPAPAAPETLVSEKPQMAQPTEAKPEAAPAEVKSPAPAAVTLPTKPEKKTDKLVSLPAKAEAPAEEAKPTVPAKPDEPTKAAEAKPEVSPGTTPEKAAKEPETPENKS
ncbi:MAG: FHA domain-containing protein [Anaerolineae bacterium]|nr:FHA domain-containing protein [Anaerolineae bacterium]